MKVFRSLGEYEKGVRPVATIGTFDGVHFGHRKILNTVLQAAKEVNGESVVLSFHPHPRLFLYPDDNPLRLLQTVEEKIERLEALGIDKLLLIPFNKQFSRLSSHQFIEDILIETVGIHKIVIGYDHRFGKNRTGSIEELRTYQDRHGFEVEEIPAQQVDNAKVSSTKIRNALHEGAVTTANNYLGYEYSVTGKVIKGEQLGRQLGYPTANVRPTDKYKLIPGDGVYLASILIDGKLHYGMLNVGSKPTVGDFPRGIEINIFDFNADIYGKTVTINFIDWIRPDKKFNGLDALVRAIDGDKVACQQKMLAMGLKK